MPPVMEGEGVIQSGASSLHSELQIIKLPMQELVAAPYYLQPLVVPPLVHDSDSEPLEGVPPAEDEGLVYDYTGLKTTFSLPSLLPRSSSFSKTTASALLLGGAETSPRIPRTRLRALLRPTYLRCCV